MPKSISERIKEQILSKYNSIDDFANKVNYDYLSIMEYVKAKKDPSAEFYQLLIEEGFDIEYIFTGVKREVGAYRHSSELQNLSSGLNNLYIKTHEKIDAMFSRHIKGIQPFYNHE